VKITLLPSSPGANGEGSVQYLTTFLINDTVAIDAGSLGVARTPAEQARVTHVLLTHSHIDHVATLPVFLENIYGEQAEVVTIHATDDVQQSLRRDVFNDRIWPDFIRISSTSKPFLRTATLQPFTPVALAGLKITPVPVDHTVPTVGFIVEDDAAAVVFSGDTGPTEAIWQLANGLPKLKAIFLEVAFPTALAALAEQTLHLTPATFARELAKVKQPVPVYAFHIKPRFAAQIIKELRELSVPNLLAVAEPGRVYSF